MAEEQRRKASVGASSVGVRPLDTGRRSRGPARHPVLRPATHSTLRPLCESHLASSATRGFRGTLDAPPHDPLTPLQRSGVMLVLLLVQVLQALCLCNESSLLRQYNFVEVGLSDLTRNEDAAQVNAETPVVVSSQVGALFAGIGEEGGGAGPALSVGAIQLPTRAIAVHMELRKDDALGERETLFIMHSSGSSSAASIPDSDIQLSCELQIARQDPPHFGISCAIGTDGSALPFTVSKMPSYEVPFYGVISVFVDQEAQDGTRVSIFVNGTRYHTRTTSENIENIQTGGSMYIGRRVPCQADASVDDCQRYSGSVLAFTIDAAPEPAYFSKLDGWEECTSLQIGSMAGPSDPSLPSTSTLSTTTVPTAPMTSGGNEEGGVSATGNGEVAGDQDDGSDGTSSSPAATIAIVVAVAILVVVLCIFVALFLRRRNHIQEQGATLTRQRSVSIEGHLDGGRAVASSRSRSRRPSQRRSSYKRAPSPAVNSNYTTIMFVPQSQLGYGEVGILATRKVTEPSSHYATGEMEL